MKINRIGKRIENILLVKKSIRFERFFGNTYMRMQDGKYNFVIEQRRLQHVEICNTFINQLEKGGYKVDCVNEVDLAHKKTENKDLLISVGGDNTFLRSASSIRNNQDTSILGINSCPMYQDGTLTSFQVNHGDHKQQIEMFIKCLDQSGKSSEPDYIEYYPRQRIQLKIQRYMNMCQETNAAFGLKSSNFKLSDQELERDPTQSGTVRKLGNMENFEDDFKDDEYNVLNEVMTAERDPSQLSIYRLNVNGRDLGKFRSSGILIATGTGSTGWLYSAKAIGADRVTHIKKALGMKAENDNSSDLIDYEIAKRINDKTIFPVDAA